MLGIDIKNRYTDTNSGYIKLYLANGKVVEEHRYVMTQHLNRELSYDEVIHHKDECKQNNNINNLVLMARGSHASEHGILLARKIALTCPVCAINFTILPSQYKYRTRRGQDNFYCSRNCMHIGLTK